MAERKIGAMTVKVDRPLATEALRLQARLMKAAGGIADQLPSILGDLQQANSEEGKRQVGIKAIGLLTDVFDRLDAEEYTRLVGDIIGLAKIQRPSGHYEQADIDGDFSENLGNIIPVCAFVLKEVFGSFFSGGQGNGRPRAAAVG